MSESFDLIVVGLGAMGAAVSHHAQRRGLSVLGIDRYSPPHDLGSTHAETRITRLAVGEGPQYLPFVARSHELWRELERLSGEQLLHECGGYIITDDVQTGDRWSDFVTATAGIADAAGIEYSVLDPASVRAEQPLLLLPDDVRVGFEPTAGLVMAERCVSVQLEFARRAGAILHTGERVLTVGPDGSGVRVETDVSTYRAAHVVLAAGPWLQELVGPRHADHLTVTRQVVYWFEVDDLERFRTENFPFVMWVGERDEDYVSFFPTPPGVTPALKILGEQFLETTTAESVDRVVTEAEADAFFERLVEPKLAGVRRDLVEATVCLYTNTPDDHFLIDQAPDTPQITVMSPCSGHGFKHSAALGEAVAQFVETGQSALDLSSFRVQ